MKEALVLDAELQKRINVLDNFLGITIKHPEWFGNVAAAREWIEQEIMQLEAEQLARLEDAKSKQPPARATVSVENNLIIPIIPAWQHGGKGAGI